jgi:hypothetical protein
MKCTDLYKKYKELDAQERRELAAAVNAHGGEFIFIDCDSDDAEDKWFENDEDENAPIILGSNRYNDESEDYYISRVRVNEYGTPEIYGFRKSGDTPADEQSLDSVEFSHISFITSLIPETDDVKDVSETEDGVPVKYLTRDDIEAVGFNSNISDEELKHVANALGKHLDYDDFRLSLIYTCEYVGLERLNTEDDA